MNLDYGTLAGLIAAFAFLLLVLFTIPVLIKAGKALKQVDATMTATTNSIQKLTEDTDDLLKQTSELVDQTNDLLADVNQKMQTIDPVVQAAAELGESVSEINTSSRKFASRLAQGKSNHAGFLPAALISIFARRLRRGDKE